MELHQDFLFTLAQISTAFVGFSTLVRSITPDVDEHHIRQGLLQDVAVIGFIVLGGSLLPYILSQLTLSEFQIWRIASAIVLLASLVSFLIALRRYHRESGSLLLVPVLGPAVSITNLVVVASFLSMYSWNLISPDISSGARYIASLVLELLVASYAFFTAGITVKNRSHLKIKRRDA